MHEESDGITENDSSEVVILPDGSHLDESLLSDPSHIQEERNNYERKLDEKLRDLGLYEDDMTINQKEELLAVVVISCETAEQEENKRQLIREYLEGAQSLEDEIEFSFQESAWLANEANLLCSSTVTKSKDSSSNIKISSFTDCESSSAGKQYENFDSVAHVETTPDIFEDETAYAEISLDPQSSSSETQSRKQLLDKDSTENQNHSGQSSCGPGPKIGITYPMLQDQPSGKSKAGELLDRQVSLRRQKLMLDKSMSSWKPCMSPTDKPVFSCRSSKKTEVKKISCTSFEEKVNKYLASFERIASFKTKQPFSLKPVQLNKPFVLLHHGSVARRACKLDNYDYIVGVNKNSLTNEEREENLPNTLTRTKSAFHRVKPSVHSRLLSFSDKVSQSDPPSKSTRSGAIYNSERHAKSELMKSESPEVILDDASHHVNNTDINFARGRLVAKHVSVHEDGSDESDKKLPQFSDLKPEICKYSTVIAPSPIVKSEISLKYNSIPCSSNSTKRHKKDETIVNSGKDYSSDSSSPLIDVETIVDDEIEEFVMKRKSAPVMHKSNFLNISNDSKRLKKNDS